MKKFNVIFFAAIFLCSCAVSYESANIKELSSPASTQVDHVNKQGLCIAARTLTTKECETYFGLNVLANGYTPVLITLENNGKKGFTVTRNQVHIVTAKADKVQPSPIGEVVTACRYSHMRAVPWWIIIIPGVFIALDIHDSVSLANELIEKDYTRKSFSLQRLSFEFQRSKIWCNLF